VLDCGDWRAEISAIIHNCSHWNRDAFRTWRYYNRKGWGLFLEGGCELRVRPKVPLLGAKYDVGVRPEISLSSELNVTLDMTSLLSICDNIGASGHVTWSWRITRIDHYKSYKDLKSLHPLLHHIACQCEIDPLIIRVWFTHTNRSRSDLAPTRNNPKVWSTNLALGFPIDTRTNTNQNQSQSNAFTTLPRRPHHTFKIPLFRLYYAT